MKILIIMGGFFPGKKYGGPPVSVENFCTLMEECDCYVITRNHDNGEKKPYEYISEGWNKRGNYNVWYLSDRDYKTRSFEAIMQDIKPDIIYLQSLFQKCVLPCLTLAKKHKIRTMLAPRGELCTGAFRKKYKKIPYIVLLHILGVLQNVHFQATSDEESEAIHKYLSAPWDHIHYLTNIPSMPLGKYSTPNKRSGYARFVFLSRIHPKKNLLSAIRYFKHIKGEADFDIYGPIEDPLYWQECQSEIAKTPSNVKITYCGMVPHDDVHRIFSQYDAFVFPTHSENYGHVIIEALTSGCQVIVSDKTPWQDLDAAGAGCVCALEDIAAFERAIQKVIDSYSNSCRENAKSYALKCLEINRLRKDYACALNFIARDVL